MKSIIRRRRAAMKNKPPRIIGAAAWAVMLLAALGCGEGREPAEAGGGEPSAGAAEDKPLTPVSIQLNWFPEVEHGGVYAAQMLEYFREAGVEATIRGGGPGIPVEQLVGRGEADFGVTNADKILIARARGVPVVALLAPIQDSPRCILVHPESGITRLEELANVTLSCGVADPYVAFLKGRLPLEGVRFVPYNFTQFLVDKQTAVQGYTFSEPILARQKGVEPTVLPVREAGYNPYTSVLIASEALLAGRPELARRVTRAVERGWAGYIADPGLVNARIMELNDQMPLEVLGEAAATLEEIVLTPEVRATGQLGMMTRERWAEMTAALVEAGAIAEGEVDVDAVFRWE